MHHANDVVAYSVVFFAEDDDLLLLAANNNNMISAIGKSLSYPPVAATNNANRAAWVDPELGLDNIYEIKHHMLTRNARANDIDRRLHPNPSARDAIETIIRAPACQSMSVEERDLIWKFRFWLKSNPRALTKFIRSVNWDEGAEVRQATEVVLEWEPIDACDALELLAPTFTHPFVRRYAVSRLQRTSYANILLYLPQLVQALRYETKTAGDIFFVTKEDGGHSNVAYLAFVFGVTRLKSHLKTASTIVEESSIGGGSSTNTTPKANRLSMITTKSSSTFTSTRLNVEEANVFASSMLEYFGSVDTDLASFLIRAACENPTIANFLYW